MNVITIKADVYQHRKIYVRCFGTEFETICFFGGQLRSNWLKVRPKVDGWVLWKLGVLPHPYTDSELEKIINVCVSAMREAIDNHEEG